MIRHHDVIIDVRIRKMTGDCQPTFLRNHSGCIQLHFLVQDLAEATGVIPRADCDEIVSLSGIITFLKSVFLSGFHFSRIILSHQLVRRHNRLHHQIATCNGTHIFARPMTGCKKPGGKLVRGAYLSDIYVRPTNSYTSNRTAESGLFLQPHAACRTGD